MAKKKSPEEQKEKALDRAVQEIEKQYGKGAIMKLGEDMFPEVPSISTGSLSLDIATGVGGIPRGRICEVYGPEASGKTTLCYHIMANAQKAGGTAAFIDTEHALDPTYARNVGMDTDSLLVAQPDSGEQALDMAEMLIRSNALDVVVVDSVAALVPRAEIEGEMGDAHVGLQARLMSQAMRKLSGAIKKSQTSMIFTNQIRMKIGVMFGNPETTPGGRALKFYASLRLDMRRVGRIKENDQFVGNRTRVTVVKNKVAPPFRRVEFDILFGEGISREGDVLDLAEQCDLVTRSGSWYSYGDVRLGQGRERSRQFLKDNPEVCDELAAKVLVEKGLAEEPEQSEDGEDDENEEENEH
ncbi:MAG: recombinase RecA [Planctomycetota bacterium]